MHYSLKELLDIPTVQSLLDSLDEINKLPSAILDVDGNILTATSWQDICVKFHRLNHDTERRCRESDTRIKLDVGNTTSHIIYPCPMGLIDAASPIIVEGKHLGNVFIGQLFVEQPVESYFIEQARMYGFDEEEYLTALRKVPLCSEDRLRVNLSFIANFVQVLAEEGLKNKRQLEAERELQENEKRLNVIFETSEAGIMVVSPRGIITYANKRMATMFGLPLDELLGTHYVDYIHESERQAGIKCMQQITKGEKTSIELIRHYVRKDGTDFWGNLTGTRFENLDGGMRDQIIVISDISERKHAEDEKRLLEQQLQQAQKLESLGVLAGGIAHDFNNILTIIRGNVFLAMSEPEKSNTHLTNIDAAVDRAAGLCQQMMAYAGKAPFTKSKINLVTIADNMIDLLKSTIPQNAAIKFNSNNDAIHISGDTNQLSQILMNLVINASEAIGTDQGEIHIILKSYQVTTDNRETDYIGNEIPKNSYACIEVTDNGVGMDEVTQKRIFEPFYTTKFVGRGLGMSAVLGIVAAHNGSIQLTSQLGKGTTFKIYIPLEQAYDSELNSTLLPVENTKQRPEQVILIVEDEDQVRNIASIMLRKLGYKVYEASNGLEALDRYRENSEEINLVITDIGMPLMDGHELIEKLKLMNPTLPIYVASGFSEQMVFSRTPSSDLAGVLTKPFKFDALKDILEA